MQRAALQILHNDAKYIVINKPAKVAMQAMSFSPAGKAWEDLLKDAQTAAGTFEPLRSVHRLDSGTSGVLILAKSAAAAKSISTQFRANQVKKTYLAIVKHAKAWGHGKTGLLEASMRITETGVELSKKKQERRHCDDEKDAKASWTHLSQSGPYALLQYKPVTGRKHQLRLMSVKLLSAPIVGDFKYGYSGDPVEGHLLHCSKLEFYTWQKSGKRETLSVTAPLPQSFLEFATRHALSLDATNA